MSRRPSSPVAVGLLFLANGLAGPALLPRFPQLADATGATGGRFGLGLVGLGVGGIAGAMCSPVVINRIGARRTAAGSAVLVAGAVVVLAASGSVLALFGGFFLLGLLDGIADTSQNHLMFVVQRSWHRSLTSRLHATWSAGALAATGIGTLAAAWQVPLVTQSVAMAVVALVLVGVAASGLHDLDATDADHRAAAIVRVPPPSAPALPGRRWVLVVATGVSVAAIESVANNWSALTLRDGLGAGAALAGAGPTAFAATMLLGRLAGDRLIDRVGPARAARAGAAVAMLGAGAGLVAARVTGLPVLLVVGLAVAGGGAATLFPSMLAAGDRVDDTGRGVAVASSAASAAGLSVPLVVGGLAEAFGLAVAFAVLPLAAAVATAALPRALDRPRVATGSS